MGRAPGRRPAPKPGEVVVPDGGFGGDLAGQALPFLHRYMLNYGQESTFELQVRHQSSEVASFQVSGGTRSALINANIDALANGDAVTTTIRIDDFPIFLAVSSTNTANAQGVLFVTVNLLINGEVIACLMSGSVSESRPLSFPETKLSEQIANRGNISIDNSANPAAGAEATLTLDDNEIWLVHWITIQLVTDATAAARRVQITFSPDTAGKVVVAGSTDQTASQNRDYTFAQFGRAPTQLQDDDIVQELPSNLWLEPSTVIATSTTNLQAGDNFTSLVFMRERFHIAN